MRIFSGAVAAARDGEEEEEMASQQQQQQQPLVTFATITTATTTRRTTASVLSSYATLENAAAAAALCVVPAAGLVAPLLLRHARLRGTATTTSSTTTTDTTTRTAAPPALPRPPPPPKPGDLVAWISKAAAAQQRAQQQEQQRKQQQQQQQKMGGQSEEGRTYAAGAAAAAVVVPPPLAGGSGGTFWQQTLTLSRYAPRLSSSGDGAPSYEATQSPSVPLGVVLLDGKWMWHSGHSAEEDEGGREGGGEEPVVYISDMPDWASTRHLGELIVVRACERGDVDDVLMRTMQYPGVRYEILFSDDEDEEEEQGGHPSSYSILPHLHFRPHHPPPPPEAATAANAMYACWVTSIAGTHLRTPIEHGPLHHHGIDTGEGTILHYSGGEIRLDPLPSLLAQHLAPHRLVAVRQGPQTEREIMAVIARGLSRLGEKDYCVIRNNCEHLASWATRERHVSSQVESTCMAAGGVVGGTAAFVLGVGCATMPLWAVPLMVVSGGVMGGAAVCGLVQKAVGGERVWEGGREGGDVVDLTGGEEEGGGEGGVVGMLLEDDEDEDSKMEEEEEGGREGVGEYVMVDSNEEADELLLFSASVIPSSTSSSSSSSFAAGCLLQINT